MDKNNVPPEAIREREAGVAFLAPVRSEALVLASDLLQRLIEGIHKIWYA